MQKPFTINQTMRDKVADQLTIQAVAQHGPRIGADLAALNDQFWARHRLAVEALPGLDSKHWAELIQSGALTAISTCMPAYMKPQKDAEPRRTELNLIPFDYSNESRNALVAKILCSGAYTTVRHYLLDGRNNSRGWHLKLVSPTGSVPRLNDMDLITEPVQEALALLICADLVDVVEAAISFRSQAMDVLMSCRTSRQVEDLFPEAANLLPQPVKNEKALAPTELAASVRSMLSKGVPPVTAGV